MQSAPGHTVNEGKVRPESYPVCYETLPTFLPLLGLYGHVLRGELEHHTHRTCSSSLHTHGSTLLLA